MMYSISFVSVKLRRRELAVADGISFPHSLFFVLRSSFFFFFSNFPFFNMSSSFDAVEFIARLGFASVHNSSPQNK